MFERRSNGRNRFEMVRAFQRSSTMDSKAYGTSQLEPNSKIGIYNTSLLHLDEFLSRQIPGLWKCLTMVGKTEEASELRSDFLRLLRVQFGEEYDLVSKNS